VSLNSSQWAYNKKERTQRQSKRLLRREEKKRVLLGGKQYTLAVEGGDHSGIPGCKKTNI